MENFSSILGKISSILGKFLLNIRKIPPQKTGSRRQKHFLLLCCWGRIRKKATPNRPCRYWYCKWWLFIILNHPQQSMDQNDLILATLFCDGTDLRRSPQLLHPWALQACFAWKRLLTCSEPQQCQLEQYWDRQRLHWTPAQMPSVNYRAQFCF